MRNLRCHLRVRVHAVTMAALCKVQYYARKDEREGENKPSTSEFASAYYKTTVSEAARRQKRIFHHRNSGETSTQIGTMRNDLFAIDEPPSQPVMTTFPV